MDAPPDWVARIVERAPDDYRFLMGLFKGRGGRSLPPSEQWRLLDMLIDAYVWSVRPGN